MRALVLCGFLANLDDDPGEATNRIDDRPEIARELETLHDDWLGSLKSD